MFALFLASLNIYPSVCTQHGNQKLVLSFHRPSHQGVKLFYRNQKIRRKCVIGGGPMLDLVSA